MTDRLIEEEVHPRPDLMLRIRPDLGDAGIVEEVFDWNVYRVTTRIRDAVVIDCGAHIGSFAVFCASLGARAVYAIEPEPDNLRLLHKNARPWPQITVIEAAVGPGGYVAGESGQAHTLGVGAGDGTRVPHVTLAGLLDEYALAEVDVLKADCEGGEMTMLVECDHDHLRRIERIAMEWHGSIFHRGSPVAIPSVGELVEHLLYTHKVDVGGLPDQWGQLHATRYKG